MCRDFRQSPSERLNLSALKGDLYAWAFDLAASYRLRQYDNKRDWERLKIEVQAMGGQLKDDGAGDDENYTPRRVATGNPDEDDDVW